MPSASGPSDRPSAAPPPRRARTNSPHHSASDPPTCASRSKTSQSRFGTVEQQQKIKKQKSSRRQNNGDINDTKRDLQPMHPHVFTPTPKNNSTRSLNWKSSSSQQTPHLSAHRCNNGMQKKMQKQTVDTDRAPKFGNGPLRSSA